MIVIWAVSSAVVDIIIAACMTALLLHAKSSAYFEQTRNLLSRLIRIILQTGLVTAVLALLVVPLYNRGTVSESQSFPVFLLGKSYVISLLANLNARTQSNALTVHGIGSNQGDQATRVSTVVFTLPNRHRKRRNGDSLRLSASIHSTNQAQSQGPSISEQQEGMKSPV